MQNLFAYFGIMGGIATTIFFALVVISSVRRTEMKKWWMQNLAIALCMCAIGTITSFFLPTPATHTTYGQSLDNLINKTSQNSP